MIKLGSPLIRFQTVPSTNDVAREMASSGAPEGTAVVAREQTEGRGRHGRSWYSPAGTGLYLSVILRPRISPACFSVITLAAAVAVSETLGETFGLPSDIKWPNDVLVRSRKICGILAESASEAGQIQYAVLGIGVNVAARELPEEIRETATSLFIETGREVMPEDFLKPLLPSLERWYQTAISEPDAVIGRSERLSSYARDCPVSIVSADGVIEGITRGITSSGSLLIATADGASKEIFSGELRVRKGRG